MCFAISLFASSAQPLSRLFLVAGQSNAVGVGNADTSIIYFNPQCFEYITTDSLRPLLDPVGYTTENEDFQPAFGGSAWLPFADAYQKLNGGSVVIVQAAKGGTACHEKADGGAGNWSSNYHLFSQAITKAKKAEAFTGKQIDGIIWLQGESDAVGISQNKISACDYKAALQNLIQRFRNELHCNLPFYIIQTGLFTPEYDAAFNIARGLQAQVAAEDPLTFIVDSSANQYRALGYMTDAIHFDQRALNIMGSNAGKNVYHIQQTEELDSCFALPATPLSPDWAVYPSPFNNQITVELRNFSCGDVDVNITDLSGKKLINISFSCSVTSPAKFAVNTSALKAGLYVVRVSLNNLFTLTRKLIKE